MEDFDQIIKYKSFALIFLDRAVTEDKNSPSPTTDNNENEIVTKPRTRTRARLERSQTLDSTSSHSIAKSATTTIVEQSAQITDTAISKGL